jgi:hypothetical protein
MLMTRRIAAWLLEREREEAARRAAIESAIAKPPPPPCFQRKLDRLESVWLVCLSRPMAADLFRSKLRDRREGKRMVELGVAGDI